MVRTGEPSRQLWSGYLVEARDDANFHFSFTVGRLFAFNAVLTLIPYFSSVCQLSFLEYQNNMSRVTHAFDFHA